MDETTPVVSLEEDNGVGGKGPFSSLLKDMILPGAEDHSGPKAPEGDPAPFRIRPHDSQY